MAVVTVKSAAITNRDAVPKVSSNGRITGAPILRSSGLVAAASGDNIGSKYIFCSVPSNSVVSDVKLTTADIGTTGTIDIGLYKSTIDGGGVVDADFFGSAVVVNAGALAKVSYVHESTVYAYTDIEKPLWLALGLTVDPGLLYDVVATTTGTMDGAGTLLLEVEYTV